MEPQNFFNIERSDGGLHRELAPGITTTVYTGDHAQISVVRIQGDLEVAVQAGDFWRTPGHLPHTMRAGAEGMVVMDIFAPPRKAYEKAGSGFATEEGA